MARNKAQDWPSQYLGFGLRCVPMLPQSKAPYKAEIPDSLTGWHIQFMDRLEAWNTFIRTHRLCNTAILWPGTQVDCDSQAAMAWTREHGITRADRAWILKTSRGYRLFYKTVDKTLRPVIDNCHEKPDLLPPGRLAIVPDSIHPSGYAYSWLNGYSPLDIPLTEIQEVPAPIVEYWQSHSQAARYPHEDKPSPGWLGLVCMNLQILWGRGFFPGQVI